MEGRTVTLPAGVYVRGAPAAGGGLAVMKFAQKGHMGWRAVSSVGTASRVRHVSLTMGHVPGAAWRDLRDPCV